MKVLCYAALADLFKYLPESKANPQAVDVRQKLLVAAWMSLWPLKLEKYRFANLTCKLHQLSTPRVDKSPSYSALGLSHALGHKLGAAYEIPHGITSVRI